MTQSTEQQISNLLSQSKLKSLLLDEKKRRKLDKHRLVFLGVSNVANFYWCALKSYYKSIDEELLFFGSYITDRIRYSLTLCLIKEVPKKRKEILSTGGSITFDHIQDLLFAKKKHTKTVDIVTISRDFIDKNGKRKRILNPLLDDVEQNLLTDFPFEDDIKRVDIDHFPLERGNFYHERKAEKYPTIQWNFHYKQFVLVGVPDGITDRFVYEFKSTHNRFLVSFVKPVALAQANIYGYFFRRPFMRVQLFVIEENKLETFEQEVNRKKVEELLDNYIKMESGWIPPKPKPWKCKKCEYKHKCKYFS